jgi:hypothetical protein
METIGVFVQTVMSADGQADIFVAKSLVDRLVVSASGSLT